MMLALVMTLALPAGAAPTETPEAFVARSVKAAQQKGTGALADFMHPDELARFKRLMTSILAQAEPAAGDTLARAMFGADATLDSVLKLTPAEFMRDMLDGVMSRPGVTVKIGDGQVLGSVREGEVVHLVTRNVATVNELTVTKMEVVSVRPNGDSWGMLLSGELEGMADAMRASQARVKQARLQQATDAPLPPKP